MVVKLERPERYITNRDLDFLPRRNPLELGLMDMGRTVTFDGIEYPRTGRRFIPQTITEGEAIRRLNPIPAQVMSEEEALQNLRDRRAAELIDYTYGDKPTNLGISPRIDPTAFLQDASQPSLRLPGQVSDVLAGMPGTGEFLGTAVSDVARTDEDLRSGQVLQSAQTIVNIQEALGQEQFDRDVKTLQYSGNPANFPIGTPESDPNYEDVAAVRRRWAAVTMGDFETESGNAILDIVMSAAVNQGDDGTHLTETAKNLVAVISPVPEKPPPRPTTVDTGITDAALGGMWTSDKSTPLTHVRRAIYEGGFSFDDPRVQWMINNADNWFVQLLVKMPEFRGGVLPTLKSLGEAVWLIQDNKTREQFYKEIGEAKDAPSEIRQTTQNKILEMLSETEEGIKVLAEAYSNEARSSIDQGIRTVGEQWGIAEAEILKAIPLLNRYLLAGTMALRNMPEEMKASINQGLLDLTGRGAQEWVSELKRIGVEALEPGGMLGRGGQLDRFIGGVGSNLSDFSETIKGQADEFYGHLGTEGPKVLAGGREVVEEALDRGREVVENVAETVGQDVVPFVRNVGGRAREGIVDTTEDIAQWALNEFGRTGQPESFDVTGAVNRGDGVAGTDMVTTDTRSQPVVKRAGDAPTHEGVRRSMVQTPWTPGAGDRTASLVEKSVIDGANAAGNMNTAATRQSSGALDYFLGGDVGDSVRDFIGYNEPFWQEPGTGILSILQNWPTDAPWGSTFGTDMGRAGQSARASAAAASLAGFEAETARMDAESKRLDSLAAMSTAGKQTLSGPIIQASERLRSGMSGLDTITQYENLLNTKQIGGMGAWTIDKFHKMGNLLGFDVGESAMQAAERFRNHIITSWEFWTGDSLNRSEQRLLNQIVPKGGAFKGDAAAYEALQDLKRRLEASNAIQVQILQGTGWSELLPIPELITSGPGIK